MCLWSADDRTQKVDPRNHDHKQQGPDMVMASLTAAIWELQSQVPSRRKGVCVCAVCVRACEGLAMLLVFGATRVF